MHNIMTSKLLEVHPIHINIAEKHKNYAEYSVLKALILRVCGQDLAMKMAHQ